MKFLVRGIQEHNEPGFFMCFEGRTKDRAPHVGPLRLFVRLNTAIDAVGAKRVVLDTVEALSATLSNRPRFARSPPVRVAQGEGCHRHHYRREVQARL